MSHSKLKILNKTLIYDGFAKFFEYELQVGRYNNTFSVPHKYELLRRKPVVAILAVDTLRQAVILVEQFRIGLIEKMQNPWLLEIPAGLIDNENEDPKEAARRELLEETGLEAYELMHVHDYWASPGCSDEFISVYYTEVDFTKTKIFAGNQGEHEDIRVVVKSFEEIFSLIEQGLITNALTLNALMWLMLKNK